MQTTEPTSRLLVIDDEPGLCTALAFALEDLFQVVTATTGHEGLTRLQHESIPLVLLDLHLPDLDGFEVLRRIMAFDSRITVVILTGDPEPAIVAQAQRLGAIGVLPKPWDIGTLRQWLWQIWVHTHCST